MTYGISYCGSVVCDVEWVQDMDDVAQGNARSLEGLYSARSSMMAYS